MNILRKNRKNNRKISLKRYILLIFSLIMTTFAWITYYKILNTGVQVDIQSWDMVFYVDADGDNIADPEEEQENPIEINLSDLYPGMEEKVVKVMMKNNGETPSDILYTSSEINILGNEYTVVETAPEEGEYYILQNDPVVTEGISTLDFINEPERFPFKIVIEHTQEILAGGEGYLDIKVSWPSYNADDSEEEKERKDELDTEWGYKVAKYLEDNIDNPDVVGAFHLQLRINAIGKPRTTDSDYDESFSTNVNPANYGDYVNYPIDLNGDSDTTNDWRIFYNDGNNVYLIAADYLKNAMISAENLTALGMTASQTYGIYWSDPSTLSYTITPDKYLIGRASSFTTTNANYKAVGSLLAKDKWATFVNSDYAESAIGSPTVEMFVRSWNTVYNVANYPDEQLYCDNGNEYGYYIGTTAQPTTTMIENTVLNTFEGYNNTLYYPYQINENIDGTDAGDCNGYWLSSPSGVDASSVLKVHYSGNISNEIYSSTSNYGLRPIVCVKSDIVATQSGNIWEFSEN